jgi:hypothetical protein
VSNLHVTVRFNVVTDMSQRQLQHEIAAFLDANLPLLLRASDGVRVTAYEDVLIKERAA